MQKKLRNIRFFLVPLPKEGAGVGLRASRTSPRAAQGRGRYCPVRACDGGARSLSGPDAGAVRCAGDGRFPAAWCASARCSTTPRAANCEPRPACATFTSNSFSPSAIPRAIPTRTSSRSPTWHSSPTRARSLAERRQVPAGRWFEVSALPPLAYDHATDGGVRAAGGSRRSSSTPISRTACCPRTFTFAELEELYAVILESSDRSAQLPAPDSGDGPAAPAAAGRAAERIARLALQLRAAEPADDRNAIVR